MTSTSDKDQPKDIDNELREIIEGLRRSSEDKECDVDGCSCFPEYRHPDGGKGGLCPDHAREARKIIETDRKKHLAACRAGEVDGMIAVKLGSSYVRCTWENLVLPERQVKAIRDSVSRGRSVILSGGTGVGKTHILVCILRDLFLAGENVEVWTCPDLFDKLREVVVEESPKARKRFIDHFRAVGWLFLDDLGVGKDSEFVSEQLFRIVDWRSRDESPMIVTSNMLIEDLGKKYDIRLASRLTGLCRQSGGVGIKIEGKDFRKGGKR